MSGPTAFKGSGSWPGSSTGLAVYTIAELTAMLEMCTTHFQVPYYSFATLTAMRAWCDQQARGAWCDVGPSVTLDFVRDELAYRVAPKIKAKAIKPYQPSKYFGMDAEDEIASLLAEEISREIDADILQTLMGGGACGHFYFKDSRDATLFKLTWGGE